MYAILFVFIRTNKFLIVYDNFVRNIVQFVNVRSLKNHSDRNYQKQDTFFSKNFQKVFKKITKYIEFRAKIIQIYLKKSHNGIFSHGHILKTTRN